MEGVGILDRFGYVNLKRKNIGIGKMDGLEGKGY